MSMYPDKNLGAYTKSFDACSSANSGAPSLITAAGTGDATKVTGQTIDRMASGAMANSAVITTAYLAALADTKTIAFAHEYQDSADGSTWNTAVAIEASTVYDTGTTGGTNERGVAVFDLDLSSLDRYVRINVTPDLSATGTDTATFHTVVVLGGYDLTPVSN